MARIFPFQSPPAGGVTTASPSPHAGGDGFEDLVAPHLERLYRLAYRLTGHRHDAEDLVQDLLVRLYPRRDQLAALDEPRTWLARSLYNLHVDGIRSRQRSPIGLAARGSEDLLAAMAHSGDSPETQTEQGLLQRRLVQALETLNEDQRLVVSLHDMEGYTLTELETILGTPLGTLKSRLHRARQALKEDLCREPFAPTERVQA